MKGKCILCVCRRAWTCICESKGWHGASSLIALHIIFEVGSQGTWSSSIWLGWLARKPPWSTASMICCLHLPTSGITVLPCPAFKGAWERSELWSCACVAGTLLNEPSPPPNEMIFLSCNLMPLLSCLWGYVLLSSVLVYWSLNFCSEGYVSESAEITWQLTGTREKAHTSVTRPVCARLSECETQIRARQMNSLFRGEGSGGCKAERERDRERERI